MAQLQVQPRSVLGKQVKRLRLQGLTPIHLYGAGIPSLALQADSKALVRVLSRAGRSQPVTLEVPGQQGSHITFVRDIQFDPLTSSVLHVDFLRVQVSELIEVDVPIILEGEAPAVRALNGTLFQALHTVRVKALPLEIPQTVRVSISALDDFVKAVHVADLSLPPGVVLVTDKDQLVARVTPVVVEKEEVPVEAAVAPAAEGEEAPPTEEKAEEQA
jgi:large subunit ribosomal protein L25